MERSLRKRMVASSCSAGSLDFRSSASCGKLSSFALRPGSGSAPTCSVLRCAASDNWSVALLPATSRRRFCMLSSLLSFRICTTVASRLRRISSPSRPFLTGALGTALACVAIRPVCVLPWTTPSQLTPSQEKVPACGTACGAVPVREADLSRLIAGVIETGDRGV